MNRMNRQAFVSLSLNALFLGLNLVSNFTPLKASAAENQRIENTPINAVKDKPPKESELEDFEAATKGTKKLEGLFTIYQNTEKGELYLEIKPEQLNKNYLSVTSLSSGIGEAGLFKGMPVGEMLFQWRRVENNLQFVLPNVNFRSRPGDPVGRSLSRSFSDSVLYSLKIKSIHPQRKTLLVDAKPLLLTPTDLPGLSAILPQILQAPYILDPEKSTFGNVQTFPLNIEIESIYGFTGGSSPEGMSYITSVPDSRAFNLSVHYSFSELPVNNGYRPRMADERVGYFITAYQSFSENSNQDPFVRYINRWNLEKQDPSAALSPPKKPIVFWIENTVPVEYRESVKQGILMWNKAFEKAGFINAIEVQEMPDNANWQAGDVRYNVIRWSASFNAGFLGIGPSQVNPLTGEILSADILIDASVVRLFKREFRRFVGQTQGSTRQSTSPNLCGQSLENLYFRGVELPEEEAQSSHNSNIRLPGEAQSEMCFATLAGNQFAKGAIATALLQNVLPNSDEMNKYVQQYLALLVAHEVGHTLGLRHNFHGSTLLKPEELNNVEITRNRGMVASVMDYIPANIAPPGVQQGDYFPTIVGPYDEWAIEYGYRPFPGTAPSEELTQLRNIAQRAPEAELAYAPDEDVIANLDPQANWFDHSNNPLQYSQWQLENAKIMWGRLNKRSPTVENYSDLREMFDAVLLHYFQNAMNLTLYVGGKSYNRNSPTDPNGRVPFESLSIEQQRQALKAINQYVFAEDAFEFSPELLNQLAPSRWWHWGTFPEVFRLDYPISDRIFLLQRVVLRSLLSPSRLARIRDSELKATMGKEVLKMPELFETVYQDIWAEILPNSQAKSISTIRRSLQREHVEVLLSMVLRKTRVPEDANTLAWYTLRQLRDRINIQLRRGGGLDTYTKAHLEQTRDRITKALDASLQSN